MSSIRGFYWNTEEDLEYLCGIFRRKSVRNERVGQLLVYWYINETIGIVRCAYINTTETSVRFMSQRRRAPCSSVCAAAISGDGVAAFVLAAVRNKRDRLGCTTVNVGNKTAGIGRRYLIKTIKPVVRFGATGRLSRQGVVGGKILAYSTPSPTPHPSLNMKKQYYPRTAPHHADPPRPHHLLSLYTGYCNIF